VFGGRKEAAASFFGHENWNLCQRLWRPCGTRAPRPENRSVVRPVPKTNQSVAAKVQNFM
jgi:hypothetical protein